MPKILIPSKGKMLPCLFDQRDEEWINNHTWYMLNGYPATYLNGKSVFMHRIILGLTDPKVFGDHKDGNKANNCRDNLRACTPAENRRNSRKGKNCTSIYKGSYFEFERGRFHAQLGIGSRVFNLGRYADERLAGKAYDRKALQMFGQFASVNFVSSLESTQLSIQWQ